VEVPERKNACKQCLWIEVIDGRSQLGHWLRAAEEVGCYKIFGRCCFESN